MRIKIESHTTQCTLVWAIYVSKVVPGVAWSDDRALLYTIPVSIQQGITCLMQYCLVWVIWLWFDYVVQCFTVKSVRI